MEYSELERIHKDHRGQVLASGQPQNHNFHSCVKDYVCVYIEEK